RDRETGLALGEVAPVELVGLARGRMPRVGAHHPRPVALGQSMLTHLENCMVRAGGGEGVPLRVGVGVALVAGSVLALQVLLTRLFSAALYYHFTFLSISLALLGAGAGAIAVYVRPGWFERRRLEDELAWWSA